MKKTSPHELFIEIGVEEMPSTLIATAVSELKKSAEKSFASLSLSHAPFLAFGTPRRLILYTPQLADRQEGQIETIIGPPKKVSFDANGNPTPAAIGFAKANQIALSKLTVTKTEKGEYLSIEKKTLGQSTSSLLTKIIPEIIASLHFPRSMRWVPTAGTPAAGTLGRPPAPAGLASLGPAPLGPVGEEGSLPPAGSQPSQGSQPPITFIRPIRWLVALNNGKVVPFSYAQVKSDRFSFGHRLLSPKPFKVTTFAAYQKETRKRFVLIDPTERYNKIKKEIKAVSQKAGGIAPDSDALLWQAVYSTEYPVAIRGSFDTAFLSIPKEIISTAMQEHQGYFPLTAPNGRLHPHFIAILNNKDSREKIKTGCERVLKARLSDAQFYFEEDRKIKLVDRLLPLKGVLFQEKLGTLYDKTQRLIALSRFIGKKVDLSGSVSSLLSEKELEQAATLAKCDLTTGVVREFPSLQGVMGRILATREEVNTGATQAPVGAKRPSEQSEREGEALLALPVEGATQAPVIAQAIEEHYRPRYPGDLLPQSTKGAILSIADKLDTIVGCFGIGALPSGSEDPHALRRQGLGIIQILSATPLFQRLSLIEIIPEAITCYKQESQIQFHPQIASEVEVFLRQRIVSYLQSEKIRYDIIETVMAVGTNTAPYFILRLAKALSDFSKKPLFNPLIICYKRAARILPSKKVEGVFNKAILEKGGEAEKGLYAAILKAEEAIAHYHTQPVFDRVFEALATLYHPLDRFFTEVLVMDPREHVRQNHLLQLQKVTHLFDLFGDFSKIQEGGLPVE